MDRLGFEDWEAKGRRTMKDRVVEKTRDIVANFDGPSGKVPEEAKAKIAAILQAAEERERKKAGA
jgi:trimethylamine:corrinoid methyltransferase-like protein